MKDLIAETPEAERWIFDEVSRYSEISESFGYFRSGVIWTNQLSENGEIIGGSEPLEIIGSINNGGWPLYRGDDPGFPAGRSVSAKLFTSPSGEEFITAIFGFYTDELTLRFDDLGVNPNPPVCSPLVLSPTSDDCWLNIATDPREIKSDWLEKVLVDAPLPVVREELSHNSEDWQNELIRVGLVYASIIWNPFTTTIAKEAAKDTYITAKDTYKEIWRWFRKFIESLSFCKNPVVVIDSNLGNCNASFIFRGKNVELNYKAHEALPIAAAQAEDLVRSLKHRGAEPSELVYEFDPQANRWFPSYLFLQDGRFVSDQSLLIAFEQCAADLSLGIHKKKCSRRLT